jgi:hypothetical protein
MIDLGLDPSTGDLLIVDFDATLVYGIDQIAQNLAIRLRFFLGEWFLNILAGVPYYQYFFIKDPNQIQVETFLKDEISNTEGVLEITSFSSDFNGYNRTFTVDFGCKTISGNMELNLELP